jgi:hypothetical protein
VLSPFVGLALVARHSQRWQAAMRESIHVVMLAIAFGSLAVYGRVAFGPPRPKPAAAFLLVPLGSWVLIAAAVGMAALRSGSQSKAP